MSDDIRLAKSMAQRGLQLVEVDRGVRGSELALPQGAVVAVEKTQLQLLEPALTTSTRAWSACSVAWVITVGSQ